MVGIHFYKYRVYHKLDTHGRSAGQFHSKVLRFIPIFPNPIEWNCNYSTNSKANYSNGTIILVYHPSLLTIEGGAELQDATEIKVPLHHFTIFLVQMQ